MKITLSKDTNKQALKNAYQDAITLLEQIQNATNPTNAQVVQAVKKEAEIIEKLLKVIKQIIA